MKVGARVGLALLAAAAGTGFAPAGAPDAARLRAADVNAEWLSYGKGYAEQRFSPLTQVNAATVKGLGLAWWAEFDTDRGQEATPLVVDGVLYTTTAWSKVFAFDAKTGARLWSYDPKVNGQKGFDACCDAVNRGVAAWGGKVFVGALDGRLIALDAKTGAAIWSVQTTDTAKPYTITGAPRVVGGRVIIGNGGAEYGVRGYVSAYDAETGKRAWRFYTTPNPTGAPDGEASDRVLKAKAAASWSDGLWTKSGGGGTVWDAMAYDPALDLLYVGVGNGSPWNHAVRSGGRGDNLFVSSIVALRGKTGEYVWHYQTTPGDSWDYTATQHIMLSELKLNGRVRKVLMQAPKNGFFYVLDRTSGELLSATPYVPQTWASGVDLKSGRPLETPGARNLTDPGPAAPTALGGHNWQPMAMSPATGLVYIPAQTASSSYVARAPFTYREGGWNTGYDRTLRAVGAPAAPAAGVPPVGTLLAWDPVAGRARWSVKHAGFWNGGVLATAGGLVFQGVGDGRLHAYDAATGARLWSFETQNGVLAAPMTYAVAGEQYVALMVGAGGAGGLSSPGPVRRPGRLLVFKLGGTASAPAFPPAPTRLTSLVGVATGGDVERGNALYAVNCQACHGQRVSGAFLPDLKHTPFALREDAFRAVLIDGVLVSRGMPGFSRFLSAKDAEDIRSFIVAIAAPPAPTPTTPAPATP